jgi:hypothetical protein
LTWFSSSFTTVHCDTSEPEPAVVGTITIGNARRSKLLTPVQSRSDFPLAPTIAIPLPAHITDPPPILITALTDCSRARLPCASICLTRVDLAFLKPQHRQSRRNELLERALIVRLPGDDRVRDQHHGFDPEALDRCCERLERTDPGDDAGRHMIDTGHD